MSTPLFERKMVFTNTSDETTVGASSVSSNSGFNSSDDESDVDLSPFRVSWIDLDDGDTDEKLGICSLPGCRFKNTWRSLEHDIRCLKTEGVQEVFTLCTKGELTKYRVPGLLGELSGTDIVVHHQPFLDGQVPSVPSLLHMVDQIHVALHNGRRTVIHCYGGLGRSCLVAVCAMLLKDDNLEPETAIKNIRELLGPAAIQSVKQYNFISDFRQIYEKYTKEHDTDRRSISR